MAGVADASLDRHHLDRVAGAEKLPGAVIAANPKGDVTLVEFYDLNCPFCRRASADVDALVAKLKEMGVA